MNDTVIKDKFDKILALSSELKDIHRIMILDHLAIKLYCKLFVNKNDIADKAMDEMNEWLLDFLRDHKLLLKN